MNFFRTFVRRLAALVLMLTLAACASKPQLVPHAFSFNGWKDGWADQVDLLEFSYGDGYRMVRNSLDAPRSSLSATESSLPAATSVNGPMPVGEFLSVKWRLKATSEIFDERVDLRHRLPRDMTDHTLTFVIDSRQLYVYVVTPQLVSTQNKVLLKTWLSRYNRAHEIYPTLSPR